LKAMIRLTRAPIAPDLLLREALAAAAGAGALISFTGLVRGEEGQVEALELEAYEGYAETVIGETARHAAARFDLSDVRVVHRIGRIAVGEAVVFVAAAAARRRAAFLGADFMMDYLKSKAPFWKKSHERDGARWIAPRPEDHADVARWDQEERPRP